MTNRVEVPVRGRDLVAEQYVILTSERAVEMIETMAEEEDELLPVFTSLLNQVRPSNTDRSPIDVSGFDACDVGMLESMGLVAVDDESGDYFIHKKIAFAKYYSEHFKEKLS